MLDDDCRKLIVRVNDIYSKRACLNGELLIPVPMYEILGAVDNLTLNFFRHLMYVPTNECEGDVLQHLEPNFWNDFEYAVAGNVLVPKNIAAVAGIEYELFKPSGEKILCFESDDSEMERLHENEGDPVL